MREFLKSFGRREWTVTILTAAVVVAWYAGATARANRGWVTRQAHDYYPMLTDALLSGQTYLKLEPDARLKALPDPWAGPQGVPRAHDASYFDGHYYLYFGIAPVILLYAPWRLLTGTFLVQGVGTGIFCAVGFLLAVLFYLRCKRRFFPELGAGWTGMAVLTLGLGSFVQYEINDPRFYQVPVSWALAGSMAAAHGILTALLARRQWVRTLGLAGASLGWGAAIASRPNYLFGLAAVGGVAAWLCWRCARSEGVRSPAFRRLAAAALVPAGLVGAGIAFYNYIRFDNIFEFGLRYQLASIDMRHFTLVSWANVGPAVWRYLFSGQELSIYYPFVRQVADTFGLVPWAPFALLALALPLTWRLPRCREPAWVLGVGFVLAGALANFGSLAVYAYWMGRYELDFLAALTLVAVVTASVMLAETRTAAVWPRRLLRGGVLLLLGYTFAHSFLQSLPAPDESAGMRALARLLDQPAAWFERMADIRPGPVAMNVTFPTRAAPGRCEPLVASGGGRDLVYVRYEGPDRVRFGFSHYGAGGILSDPVMVEPGRRYRLEVDMGGLYPPPEHPDFRTWSSLENSVLHRRVRVTLDGRTVLRAASVFYSSDPFAVYVGRNPMPPGRQASRFTGRIDGVRRLGLPKPASVVAGYGSGPVQLTVRFPPFHSVTAQPLVCTGRHGAGDLVYVLYLAPGKVRFGHDSWNGGAVETPPVYFNPDQDQVIDIDMGSLYPRARDLLNYSHRFQLRFNGRTIMSVPRPFHPSSPAEVVFGFNAIGASTADLLFNGSKLQARRLAAFPTGPPAHGAYFLKVAFPRRPLAPHEPLLVTGRTGAGDLLYVEYVDEHHVRFGYDHWGVGGPVSDPIPIPPGPSVDMELSMGSLYPPGDPGWESLGAEALKRLRSTVQVRLNGRIVWQVTAPAYPAADDQVFLGKNPIGGSTCSAKFSGRVLSAVQVGAIHLR